MSNQGKEFITNMSENPQKETELILEQIRQEVSAATDDKSETLYRVSELASSYFQKNGNSEAAAFFEAIKRLMPAIIKEFETDSSQTSFEDFLESERFALCMEAAAQQLQQAKVHAISSPRKLKAVDFPVDKLNSTVWGLLEKDTAGQIKIAMERKSSGVPIDLLYSINFDALADVVSVSKKLTYTDKRIYTAVAALFNAGNNICTLSQIHRAMGNTGTPSTNQLEKINASLSKMSSARITIDNGQEAQLYKYDLFKYDGALLPLERCTAMVNGRISDAAIHLFREPPLLSFARGRKQFTTVEMKVLQSPVSKTDINLQIDDYLIERIAHIKKGNMSNRILFATVIEHIGNTKNNRERIPKKIIEYLTHYKKCGFIKDFTSDAKGVTIFYDKG